MGKTNGLYRAEFPPGTKVRIAAASVLKEFVLTWRYHHPLQPSQLEYAGTTATVAKASYYHGGDELYELANIPGIRHEENLTLA